MIRSEKKLKGFAEILKKDNNLLTIEAIELLRLEKPFEGVVSLLTALYDSSDEFTIRKTISGFLNDLKDQSVCAEIIEEIRKKWKPDTISMLVSSCRKSEIIKILEKSPVSEINEKKELTIELISILER